MYYIEIYVKKITHDDIDATEAGNLTAALKRSIGEYDVFECGRASNRLSYYTEPTDEFIDCMVRDLSKDFPEYVFDVFIRDEQELESVWDIYICNGETETVDWIVKRGPIHAYNISGIFEYGRRDETEDLL